MAKRRSQSIDENEEHNPKSKTSKRARRSNDDNSGPKNTNGAEEHVLSEEKSENEEEMEVDFENCSQNPDFTIQTEAEVGIIEKVILQNFMCHKYLEVNFGSNVNFIIGRNGSGKSAIMTGLIVGLGGKAAITNRGNSLKGFIKEECSSAAIIVKLRNRGTDAYMPKQYGESIFVERKLNRDGASSYKIKSHDGKVISNKKEDLLTILDQFNIQIDNPVSLLNQDTSRCFLNSSDPSDKYKFFLKATQLEQMSMHYQMIFEKKENINITLLRKKEILPEMEQHVKVLEEKYQDMAQLKEMKEKVKNLKEELVWAIVRDNLMELEGAKKNLHREEGRVPKYDNKIEECKADMEAAEKTHEAKELTIRSLVDEATELAHRKAEFAAQFKKMRTDMRFRQESIRKKEKEIDLSESERRQLYERIEESKQKAVRDLEAERTKMQNMLAEKEQARQMVQSQLSTSIHHRNQLDMSIKSSQEKSYQMRQEETTVNQRLNAANRQLRVFKESQENKLKIFGSWVPDAVQKIKALAKQKKFTREPVGPIGACIKLKDQKWDVAIETCLKKSILLAFCCHDLHDKDLLLNVLKTCLKGAPMPSIIVSRFQDQIYDVSSHRSQDCRHTIFDMLEFSNPVAANALIDQVRIESVLLIENSKEAQQVIWHERPRGASRAFTLVGDEVIGGASTKYYSNKHPQACYLKASVESDIRRYQEEIAGTQDKLRHIRESLSRNEREVKDLQHELQKTKKKCNYEQQQINKLNIEIQDMASYEEERLPDVTSLEEDLEQYETKIDELKKQVEKEKQEMELRKSSVQEQQAKDGELKTMIEDLTNRMEPMREDLNKIVNDIQQLKSDRKFYEGKKAELMRKIAEVKKIADKLEEKYNTTYEQAKSYCEEITSERKVKNLESEITQIDKRVHSEERDRGNAEEITKKYHEAMTKYKDICDTLKSFKRFNKRLDKVLERRAKRFVQFQRYIVSRARMYFTMLLSQRGYSGKLKIDHDEETLSIMVNVEQTKGTAVKDTRSLSGGERSLSTICFIMALWEAMESPFRVLDEFDVFMDMVNRRISMEMLLKMAKEQNNRQFILLTPQDMSNISGGSNVRIYKMRDPERGQSTIPFQPVAGRE